jgi:hypothetical protein
MHNPPEGGLVPDIHLSGEELVFGSNGNDCKPHKNGRCYDRTGHIFKVLDQLG